MRERPTDAGFGELACSRDPGRSGLRTFILPAALPTKVHGCDAIGSSRTQVQWQWSKAWFVRVVGDRHSDTRKKQPPACPPPT